MVTTCAQSKIVTTSNILKKRHGPLQWQGTRILRKAPGRTHSKFSPAIRTRRLVTRSRDTDYEKYNDIESSQTLIERSIQNGLFWCDYGISISPGDGHRILHSVICSYNSQHGAKPSLEKGHLITLIRYEVMDNVTDYILHIDDNSRLKLFTYLNRYINDKVYDTSLSDLVPLIVANANKMNLVIIDKTNDECKCHIIPVVQNASLSRANSVIVIKEGEHYNRLLYVSTCRGAGSDDLVNVGGGFTRLHDEYIDSKLPNVDNNNVNVNNMNLSHAEPHDSNGVTHSSTEIQNYVYEKCVQRFTKRELKFCSWNICGLTEAKLYDDILGEFFKSFDFIFLTETWAYDIDNYNIDGYVFLNYSRHQMHHNARRNSAGIGIFIRNYIVEGVETEKTLMMRLYGSN